MEPKPLRILVVDDHADSRKFLGMYLEMIGHCPEFAVDVGSALVQARRQPFDVLLTDIGLPGRNGWDLLRLLDEQGHRPPLAISMSAFNSGHEVRLSKAARCFAHLPKPFLLAELETALCQGTQHIVGQRLDTQHGNVAHRCDADRIPSAVGG